MTVGRRNSPLLWLLYAVLFTVDAVALAALDAPRPVVVLSAITGLAAVTTFFMAARAHAHR